MPLFTMLSGYVYAMRPITRLDDFPQLARGKIIRLLIPLFMVGTLFVLVQSMLPGTNSDGGFLESWKDMFYGVSHFWFLQAIFIIFFIVGLLDAAGALKKDNYFFLIFILSCSAWIIDVAPIKLFSVDGAIRLFPFFILGYFFKTRPEISRSRRLTVAAILTFTFSYTARILEISEVLDVSKTEDRMIAIGVGVSALILIMNWREKITVKWLAVIGGYSFGIYLLHIFFTAGTRMASRKLGIELDVVIFSLCLTAGILCPIVFEAVLGRFSLVSLFILGQKQKKKSTILLNSKSIAG